MENTAFPSHNPQRVLRVGVEPVQIDLRGHLQIAVKNSVMPDPLAVITVHPLLGEEPHVSPPVFLDTVNPPVTQSVLYSQVFIYLAPHMEEIPSIRNADSILPIFRTRVILM